MVILFPKFEAFIPYILNIIHHISNVSMSHHVMLIFNEFFIDFSYFYNIFYTFNENLYQPNEDGFFIYPSS